MLPALIGYGKEFKNVSWDCDGALISEKFIMSSARCGQTSASGPPQWVLLKDVVNDLEAEYTTKSTVYSIVKIHFHSDYKPSSFQHDISLIELNTTVTFNPYLRPACLHTSTIPIHSYTTITGWERSGIAEQTSNNLLEAIVYPRVDHRECEALFNENATNLTRVYDSNTMICARDAYREDPSYCRSSEESHIKADSGGVLQIVHESCTWSIIGIASFGTGLCQHNKYPGVYTKVSHYVDWIQSIVWP
ncbi:plasma kallikrein-like [Planococcus citri]|uniref:plasma kallikrein-like n=1 Tax=Planococcus citri TaxID=170843 RepID=UPI0031F9B8FC